MSHLTQLPIDALQVASALRAASAPEILQWIELSFGDRAAIASSFSVEDVVLIDLARQHAAHLRVFTLDTGRLHPETYEVMEAVRRRYGLEIETYFPDRQAVESLERDQGYFSFRESLEARKTCCAVRKVEPLSRALAGRAAWVTGLRREQSPIRGELEVVERDQAHALIKINPLASWSESEIWTYVRDHGVPYNALYDQGFASIGCAPCTRAIKAYEDTRAGRWWWESSETKECGLHAVGGAR